MKNFLLLSLLASMMFLFTGCIEIFENLYLNKDGSGRYEVKVDMSALMSQEFKDMMASFSEEEEEEEKEAVEVDSVIWFKDMAADKIKNLDRPEVFEKASLKIQMSDSKELMIMTTIVEFTKLEDIDYFNKHSASLMESMGDGGAMGIGNAGMMPQAMELFKLKGRKLTRMDSKPGGGDLVEGDDMEMMSMMLADAVYTTTYHLPGAVKKTSIPGARIDGKKVIVENNLIELINGNSRQDGTIKFKRK